MGAQNRFSEDTGICEKPEGSLINFSAFVWDNSLGNKSVDLAAALLKMRADAANRHQISLVDSSAFLTGKPNSEWNCEANPALDH